MDPAALGLALVAGAVAAFNPCGFALLPAYLTMLVARTGDDTPTRAVAIAPGGVATGLLPGVLAGGTHRAAAAPVALADPRPPVPARSPVVRAVRFTTGMTAGFVAVFGVFGLLIAPLALSLERWLPVVTVVLGIGLVGLGLWLLAGRALPGPSIHRGRAPGTSWASQVGYGVTFALASLSCTIGPFLAVTVGALRDGSPLGVVGAFVAYALGMGAVVGVLALAAATAGAGLAGRMRRLAPVISRLSGALLVVAGAYVAWYGWFELRVLGGGAADDPVVLAAIRVQSELTQAVTGLGIAGVAVAAAVVATALAVAVARRRR